jgi:O-antigen/teichoic acid export membrane protein
LQHQSKEYENLLLNFLLLMLILILPFYAVLFLMAEPFIVIFYGQKWLAAIPILQVLCFAGIFRSLWTMVSAIVMSIGKPQFEFQLNSLIAVCLIPGMYALKSTGLLSLIIYFTVLLGLTYAYANYKIIKMLKISWKQILRKIRVPILATLILFFVVLILTNGIMPMDNQYIFTKFMILLAVSITVYIGAVYVLDSSLFLNLIKIVFKK